MSGEAVVLTTDGSHLLHGELLGVTGIDFPAGEIENVDISASAAIAASKCQRSVTLSGFQSGTAADATIIVFFCKGATATIKSFTVSNLTANAGSSEVDVDLKKNGTSVLSAAITLDSTKAAYSETNGTISTTGMTEGQYLTVVIDATASGTDTVATGVFWQIELDEDYDA